MDNETAVVVREESVPSLLLGTPADRVIQATQIANALSPVITDKHLYANIQGKKHVLYEGWATLGALVGVFPVTVWTRETDSGYEARVEARTLAGAVVGAAEAECSRDEGRWKTAPAYALRSMAQTRAGSKALRMPLGFIMQLAGFEGTPAEEMDGIEARPPKGGQVVVANKAKLAGYMTANKLKAIDVLRLLGNDPLDEGDAKEQWNDYVQHLMESEGMDEDTAYGTILKEIGG